MKRNELMISDWVLCNNKYVQISSIKLHNVGVREKSGLQYGVPYTQLSDIPLTKEILDKNFIGNVSTSNYSYYARYCIKTYNDSLLCLSGNGPNEMSLCVSNKQTITLEEPKCVVRNIRELQHALRVFKINHKFTL